MAAQAGISLVPPPGYRALGLETVDSTNREALQRARDGETSGLWIVAGEQTGGRGRSGRSWSSPPGNLYASLLLRTHAPLSVVQQLSLLAPVAAFDTCRALLPADRRESLRLKWPNDVLCAGAKLCGILLESTPAAAEGDTVVVIGWGLNVASHPQGIGQATTDLAVQGARATVAEAFTVHAERVADWLAVWAEGAGFRDIREAWLARAGPVGTAVAVRQGDGRIAGTYLGLDDDGALLLRDAAGVRHRILHGDVAHTSDSG